MSCEHETLDLRDRIYDTRVKGDAHNLPRQVNIKADCPDCGETVTVDYNIAFVDGDEV